MGREEFDLESFYVWVGASGKERAPLRQDLVRGLKDYYLRIYGYDRYGAETAFHLGERLSQPLIYGFAVLRILHDRRISDATKIRVAERSLEVAGYGDFAALPFGLVAVLRFLMEHDRLETEDLRYALLLSAGQQGLLADVDKRQAVGFLCLLLERGEMTDEERVFWAHSLLGRHHDQPGAGDLINLVLGAESIPAELRRELCWAWVSCRQPRVEVPAVPAGDTFRSRFAAEHLPFWVAHMPSWPSLLMIRLGLIWLARLGEDPLTLAQTYIGRSDPFAEQLHSAVAEIIAEHHRVMPEAEVRALIDQGTKVRGWAATRKKFYRLGADLFGPVYVQRALDDAAASVRQWAQRQVQKEESKEESAIPGEEVALAPRLGN